MLLYIHEDICPMSRKSFYLCLASLNTPRNYALWTKLRVLSHHCHPLYSMTYHNEPIVATAFLESSDPISPERLLMWNHAESANFKKMGMTLQSRVVFRDYTFYILADQWALETGMVLFTVFENNGTLEDRMRVNIEARSLAQHHHWAWERPPGIEREL
ncbi:hypothetical protein OCU04_005799 [Sclerotinia nivalis]|uniref:Uncharacterized protein n=1 Tax=Sclerotinia nivalis TaxID=352851 RepID=A0A9X0DIS1_9HELO|nr:hypothetical protein OCU04_005799 [Sclerotinia nivalis]